MKKSSNQSINKQKILQYVLIVALLLSAAYYIFGRPIVEKARFEKLDKEAHQYIQEIARKYPGEVKRERYCEYSSEKFGRGPRYCSVVSTLSSKDRLDREIFSGFGFSDWGEPKDYTESAKTTSKTIVKHLSYNKGKVSCSVSQHEGLDGGFVTAHCSGPALQEYYPLKTNP